jgi:outer membrane autotransporter protein
MQRQTSDGISLSKTHGDIFRGKIDFSYAYNHRNDLVLIPQIGISYDNFKIQNFKEEDFNAYIKHKNSSKIASNVALKIKKFTHYNKFDLAPYLNFNIDQTLKLSNGKVSIRSGDSTPKLVVNQKQAHIPKTTYTIGVGTSISKSNDIELGVGYDYSFRSKMYSHSYFATLKLNL